MARCSCGEDCEITCTGDADASTIGKRSIASARALILRAAKRASWDLSATVDVSVKGLPLITLAAHVNRLTGREILVPASKANKRVNLRLKKVRLRAAIRKLPAFGPEARRRDRGRARAAP